MDRCFLIVRRFWIQCGFAVAAGSLVSGVDYLPAVGPPPLRFEAPAGPATVRFILPPLEPAATLIATNELAAGAPKAQVPATSVEPSPLLTNSVSVEGRVETAPDPAPLPGATPWTTPAAPLYSPQMFLQYFTPQNSTNGAGAAVVVPMNFLPPVPLVTPSSTATSQITPAHKP